MLRNDQQRPAVRRRSDDSSRRKTAADISGSLTKRDSPLVEPLAEVDECFVNAREALFETKAYLCRRHFSQLQELGDFDRISLHCPAAQYAEGALARYLQAPRRFFCM